MIELDGVQKIIGPQTVLQIDTLRVAAGEILALVGPPGNGQDVLFDLLIGRQSPSAGSVRVAGVDPRREKALFSERVGVLFAEDGLYARQSALGNLVFHGQLHALTRARAADVLAQVGLADHANVPAGKLPAGLARRLAFGRAILHHPQTLILVEPFARCDEASLHLLSGLLRRLAEEGAAILIVSTTDSNLGSLCDTVCPLEQGRLGEARQPLTGPAPVAVFKIPVRLEGKVVLINPADILYVEAESGTATLHTRDGGLPTQFTLIELEERLSRSGFFRAHRAYLVNLQHIKEVIPYTRNAFALRLDDPNATEIPLSKSAAGDLRSLLGY